VTWRRTNEALVRDKTILCIEEVTLMTLTMFHVVAQFSLADAEQYPKYEEMLAVREAWIYMRGFILINDPL
jgi:hypothetical protein